MILCLSLESVGQWDQSVNQANRNKRGHPFGSYKNEIKCHERYYE
jgi:hypothetical protein